MRARCKWIVEHVGCSSTLKIALRKAKAYAKKHNTGVDVSLSSRGDTWLSRVVYSDGTVSKV